MAAKRSTPRRAKASQGRGSPSDSMPDSGPSPAESQGRKFAPTPLPHEAAKAAVASAERARATALTEWRRMDLRPMEGARRRAERPVSDILSGVLRHIRLDQRQAESQVVAVWKQVIDPSVVAHARPVNLAKGTLFVAVDSSPWLAEIVRYRSKEILERLQLAVGRDVVQRISYRVG